MPGPLSKLADSLGLRGAATIAGLTGIVVVGFGFFAGLLPIRADYPGEGAAVVVSAFGVSVGFLAMANALLLSNMAGRAGGAIRPTD
jgi:hypothetical protein